MDQDSLLALNEIVMECVDLPNFGRKDAIEAKSRMRAIGTSKTTSEAMISVIMTVRSKVDSYKHKHEGVLGGIALAASIEERRGGPQIHLQSKQELSVMRDNFENSGQVGAMGPKSHAHDMAFVQQQWDGLGDRANPESLAIELGKLLEAMRSEASEPEHFEALSTISHAKRAAETGDGPKSMLALRTAGAWAIDVATKIGTSIATDAIKASMGM